MNPILFYGAGHTGQKLRKLYKIKGEGNVAFLDSHKSGTLDGVPVYQPESVPVSFHTMPVLLTIHSDVNLESIRQRLIDCGWEASKIWTLSEFYLQMQMKGIEMPDLYWLRQMEWPVMGTFQKPPLLFKKSKCVKIFLVTSNKERKNA